MDKFTIKAKLTSCQDMINDLNDNIEAFNQLIAEFKAYAESPNRKTDVDFEYVTKSKVQVDGFRFLIKDRLSLFKDPIMTNAIDAEDEDVIKMVDDLKKELELDVSKFKMLFRLYDLSGKAV